MKNLPIDLIYLRDKYPQVENLVISYNAACERADTNANMIEKLQADVIDTTRRLESAEQRAAQLQAERDTFIDMINSIRYERDTAAYQARMEAARIAYDAAQQFKTDNCFDYMHAAMIIFRQIAGEYAERKS